jgi:hypothetical protein
LDRSEDPMSALLARELFEARFDFVLLSVQQDDADSGTPLCWTC